jgi:VCBS repeat-containing protein
MMTLTPAVGGDVVSTTGTTGVVGWEFTGAASQFEYLGETENLVLTYTVVLEDGNGGVITEDIVVTIDGSNDAPVVSGTSNVVTSSETEDTDLVANGVFEVFDADTTDTVSILSTNGVTLTTTGSDSDSATPDAATLLAMFTPQSGQIIGNATQNGSVEWSFNANGETFDYLKEGETITLNYKVAFADDSGTATAATGPSEQTVSITITGANDKPFVSAATDVADTQFETNAALIADGTFVVTDVDTMDTVTLGTITAVSTGNAGAYNPADLVNMFSVTDTPFSLGSTSNTGTATWNFNSGSAGAFDYLARGESLEITYTIPFSDNSGVPASNSNSQTVVVTINGTNDGPTIEGTPTALQTRAAGDTATVTSGSIEIEDLDVSDVVTVSEVRLVTAGLTGDEDGDQETPSPADLLLMLDIRADDIVIDGNNTTGTINWDFTPGTEKFDYLASGETLALTYTVVLADQNGGTNSQTIQINVAGGNNTPTVTAQTDVSETLTETDAALLTAGSFNIEDLDTTDTVSVTGLSVVTSGDDTPAATNAAMPTNAELLAMFSPNSGAEIDNASTTGTVEWAFNAGTEAFDHLNLTETLTLTYTLTIADQLGASTTQDVVINVNGTNDSATIGGDLAAEAATDSGIIVTGRVTTTDLDDADNLFTPATGNGTYGSYTVDSGGNWTYTLDDSNPTVDALTLVSDEITDSFTVTANDGTTETVVITISDDPMVGDAGNNTILGRLNDDVILGGAGNDVLFGAAGSDVLNGGSGVDQLTGAAGADTFQFTDLGLGIDEVLDFEFDTDRLDITSLLEGGATVTVTPNAGATVTEAEVIIVDSGVSTTVANVTFASGIDSATFDSDTLFAANNGAVTS